MEYIAVFLIGVFAGAIIISLTVTSSRNALEEEKYNAENRAMDYARAIKTIEDIALKPGYGSIVDRLDKIIEVIQSSNINNF